MRKLLFELTVLLALTGPALAAPGGPVTANHVTVSDAWFRRLPAGLPAGGYFTARNAGDSDLAITGAQSPACGMLMLHRSSDTGGMSSMAMVASVPLPAKGSATFTPGGYHLMCMDPKPSLKIGGKVAVVLTLSDGTSVAAEFSVRNATGK